MLSICTLSYSKCKVVCVTVTKTFVTTKLLPTSECRQVYFTVSVCRGTYEIATIKDATIIEATIIEATTKAELK